MREFIYQVDANWVAFAAENGLPALTAEAVTGKSLWNYLLNSTSKQFYKIFMAEVRKTGRPITVPFRCDSPECRRFMKLCLLSLPDGALEFRSGLIREEARPRVNLLDPEFPRTEEFLTMCAWCKKVKAPDWMEAEDAVQRLKFFDQPQLPRISHGICEDCSHVLRLIAKSN